MADFDVSGPYVGALLMSLGALCAFIWGVLSGALSHTDEASIGFFEREMENGARAAQRLRERDAP